MPTQRTLLGAGAVGVSILLTGAALVPIIVEAVVIDLCSLFGSTCAPEDTARLHALWILWWVVVGIGLMIAVAAASVARPLLATWCGLILVAGSCGSSAVIADSPAVWNADDAVLLGFGVTALAAAAFALRREVRMIRASCGVRTSAPCPSRSEAGSRR